MSSHHIPITVRLDSFEGPLDLLLYLIQSHELDISKVSIGRITDQYLAYVKLMQELNFDAASEFLVMASTLLHWKSKSLLPDEEKKDESLGQAGEDPLSPEALVRQLQEHQRFKQAGQDLAELPLLGLDVFCRANSKPPVEKIWKEMNITDLAVTYQEMLVRQRKRTHVLRKETVSIADKIRDFSSLLSPLDRVEFRKLLSEFPCQAEIVATFLASLELARLKKMRIYQEGVYSVIYLELLESLEGFDLQLATGFDSALEGAASGQPLMSLAPAPELPVAI